MRSDRRARQMANAMRAASASWSTPTGASSACRAAVKARNSAWFSSSRTTIFCARRPCLRALRAATARPWALTGPRERAPLRRLACARAFGLVLLVIRDLHGAGDRNTSCGAREVLTCAGRARRPPTRARRPSAKVRTFCAWLSDRRLPDTKPQLSEPHDGRMPGRTLQSRDDPCCPTAGAERPRRARRVREFSGHVRISDDFPSARSNLQTWAKCTL